jgi:hypothetical protein
LRAELAGDGKRIGHTCQVFRPRRVVWTLAFTRPHVYRLSPTLVAGLPAHGERFCTLSNFEQVTLTRCSRLGPRQQYVAVHSRPEASSYRHRDGAASARWSVSRQARWFVPCRPAVGPSDRCARKSKLAGHANARVQPSWPRPPIRLRSRPSRRNAPAPKRDALRAVNYADATPLGCYLYAACSLGGEFTPLLTF